LAGSGKGKICHSNNLEEMAKRAGLLTGSNRGGKMMALIRRIFFFSILCCSPNSFSIDNAIMKNGSPEAAPARLQTALDRAEEECQLYYKQFRQFIAREKQIQKKYDRNGKLAQQRMIISDYYVVSLPSHPENAVEFRDTISVDGKEVNRNPQRIKELFERHTADLEGEIRRINKESTQYYLANQGLGDLANTWYQYTNPEHRKAIDYRLLPGRGLNGELISILEFQEPPDKTLIHFRDLLGRTTPIPAKGQYHLSAAEERLLRVDITVNWGGKNPYPLGRWIKDFALTSDGMIIPSRLSTTLYQGHKEEHFLETESTYDNFRQFAIEVKFTSSE
jgi:hypothetical protein